MSAGQRSYSGWPGAGHSGKFPSADVHKPTATPTMADSTDTAWMRLIDAMLAPHQGLSRVTQGYVAGSLIRIVCR
jgi:hypothetical protein